jgi:hypothetical protein
MKGVVYLLRLISFSQRAAEAVRKNMSVNIQRSFMAEGAVHFLPFQETTRKQTERNSVEKMLCPPLGLFDAQLSEAFAMIDSSGVFRRFVKSRQPKKKKLFKTLGSRRRGVSTSGSMAQSHATSALTQLRNSPSLSRKNEPAPDDKLEY